ncbi:hypothetical protein CLOP_g2233 [Closterium sp. NIES-67]|nr:hypothetical protein CLOP_g2233 [Closterium sp. NIES-67]
MKWESSRPLDIHSSPSRPAHADSVLALPLSTPLLQPPPPHVSVGRRAAHLAEVFTPNQRFASVPAVPGGSSLQPSALPSIEGNTSGTSSRSRTATSSLSLSLPSSTSSSPPSLPFGGPCRAKPVDSAGPAVLKRGKSAGYKERLLPADSSAASNPDSETATRSSASGSRQSTVPPSSSVSFRGRSNSGNRLVSRSEENGDITRRDDGRAQQAVTEWGDSGLSAPLVAFERRLDEAEEWLGAAMTALGARSRSLAQAAATAASFPQERWEKARGRWQAKLRVEGGRVPARPRGTQRRLAVKETQLQEEAAGERRVQISGAEGAEGAERERREGEREGKGVRVRGGVPEQLMCGAFAGIVSRTAVAPLDLIRTHLISSNGLPGAHKTAGSVFSAIMARDGWKGFFRGNGVNCLRVGPHKAVELCTFEMLKRLLCRPGHPLQHVAAPLSGAAAGLAGTLLTYPLELIRTRISVQPELYRDLGSTVRRIVQEEGALSLYRGIVPSLLGVVPYAASNYFVYDALRTAYRKATGRDQVPNEVTLLFGAAAASASSAVTFPLEVVRRRLQLGVTGTAGPQTAIAILKGICEADGVMAVYRGLGTTWLKLLPAAGISFVCYEAARVALRVDDASMAGGQESSGLSSSSSSSKRAGEEEQGDDGKGLERSGEGK